MDLPDWLGAKLLGWANGKAPEDLLWPEHDILAYCLNIFNDTVRATKIWREGMGPHTLRRCFATYTQGAGLREAMGHNRDSMTAAYIRPTSPMRLSALESLRSALFPVDCQ